MSVQSGETIFVQAYNDEPKGYYGKVGEVRRVNKTRKNNAPIEGGTLAKIQNLENGVWKSYYLEKMEYNRPSPLAAIWHNTLCVLGLRKGKI